jgi:hypothetical protein
MSATPGELPILQVDRPRAVSRPRARLIRRARLLAWIGLGWHGIEASVAIAAGAARRAAQHRSPALMATMHGRVLLGRQGRRGRLARNATSE